MIAVYDDLVLLGEDEEGEPIYFDWLRDGDSSPVRVQVQRDYVEGDWGIAWEDEGAVSQVFNVAKLDHIAAALQSSASRHSDYRVYTIRAIVDPA